MEQRTKLSYKKIIIALLCILAVVYIVYHIAQSLRDDVELFAVSLIQQTMFRPLPAISSLTKPFSPPPHRGF